MCGVVVVEHAKASWRHGCGEHSTDQSTPFKRFPPADPATIILQVFSLHLGCWLIHPERRSARGPRQNAAAFNSLPCGVGSMRSTLSFTHTGQLGCSRYLWIICTITYLVDILHTTILSRFSVMKKKKKKKKTKKKTTAEELVIRVSASLKTLLSSFSSWELKHKI